MHADSITMHSMKKYILFLLIALCLLVTVVYAANEHHRYVAVTEAEVELQNFQKTNTATSSGLRIPILIYHSVRPNVVGDTLLQRKFDVVPGMLEQQLEYLQTHGYTAITLDQLVVDLQTGTTSSLKPVVLTFDDAWQNQYVYAFPLLKKYHDTATFFIYTNPIDKDARFLTWAEIKEMQAAGMTIGSHTLTHPYLTKLTPEQLHKELFDSKKIIEAQLGEPIHHFASPFGYMDSTIQSLLKEAGYTTGRTTFKGSIQSRNNLFGLNGYFAPQTLDDFKWILNFAP